MASEQFEVSKNRDTDNFSTNLQVQRHNCSLRYHYRNMHFINEVTKRSKPSSSTDYSYGEANFKYRTVT